MLKIKQSITICITPHLNKIPDMLVNMRLHKPHRTCKGGRSPLCLRPCWRRGRTVWLRWNHVLLPWHKVFPTPNASYHPPKAMEGGQKYTLTWGCHVTPSLDEQSRRNQKQLILATKPQNHVLSPQIGLAVCLPGQGGESMAAAQGAWLCPTTAGLGAGRDPPTPPSAGRAPWAKPAPTTREGIRVSARTDAVLPPSPRKSSSPRGSNFLSTWKM